jgi:molecular chaperone IbpA
MEVNMKYTLPTLFDQTAIGFNKLYNEIMEECDSFVQNKFPVYNLTRYENSDVDIVLAVAGYAPENLEVETCGDKIVIRGDNGITSGLEGVDTEQSVWGIARRRFERVFPVAGKFEVTNVELLNGLLTIKVKRDLEKTDEVIRHEIVTK